MCSGFCGEKQKMCEAAQTSDAGSIPIETLDILGDKETNALLFLIQLGFKLHLSTGHTQKQNCQIWNCGWAVSAEQFVCTILHWSEECITERLMSFPGLLSFRGGFFLS